MPSEIVARLKQDTIAAMKAKDKVLLGVLRQLQAAVKQVEIDQRIELDDEAALKVIQGYAKKVRDTLEAAQKAGRAEMQAEAEAELAVVKAYLPAELSDDALAALVDEAVAEAGASGPQDMGAVMKAVMPKVAGRADGGRVSAMVKKRLVG
jgi:uncharacterized protein YqeY